MMPAIEATFTIRPPRCFIIGRIAAFVTRNAPRRFRSRTASHSSADMRSSRLSRVIPALFTRMSSAPPPKARASFTTRSASASTDTSPWTSAARAPAASTARFVSSAAVAFPLKLMAMFAPSLASRIAVARPIPRPAPVTSAVRPASPPISGERPSGLAEDERGVVAAEAHRVRQGGLDLPGPRRIRDVVQVQRRIRRRVVDRRRDAAVAHREEARDRLERAGGPEEVSGHRLRRRHEELVRVGAEDLLDRGGLLPIVGLRRRAVGVDVVARPWLRARADQ